MANGNGPTRTRKHNPIGLRPPQKRSTRLAQHRWDRRIPVRDVLDNGRAVAGHYAILGPVWYLPRAWWRWADWTLVPTLVLVAGFVCRIPVWTVLPLALVWPAYRHQLRRLPELPAPIARKTARRDVLRMQRKLDRVRPKLYISTLSRADHRTAIEGTIPTGIAPEDILGIRSQIEGLFREETWIDFPTPGRFRLQIRHQDVLAVEAPRPELDDVLLTIGAGMIPLGIERDARRIDWPVHESNLMIAGQRGSGKSTTLGSILDYARQLPYRTFRMVDLDDGYDFGWFHGYCEQVETTVDGSLRLLERTAFVDLPARVAQGRGQIGDELFVVVDEFAALVAHRDKTIRDRAHAAIGTINARGRKASIHILAATQDLRASVVTGTLRGQFTHILGLATLTSTDSDTILGGNATRPWDLSKIDPTHKGRGVLVNGETRFQPIRAFRYLIPDPAPTPDSRALISPLSLPDPPSGMSPHPTPILVSQDDTDTDPSQPESAPSAEWVREQVAGKIRGSGALGAKLGYLVEALGVPEHRVKTALDGLKRDGSIEVRGRRWYWIGA